MSPDDRRGESRAILDRVARDTESLGASSLARIGRHFAGADAVGGGPSGATDPAELWGRRVGRAGSALLGIALAWWLGAQLGWW